MSAGTEPIAGSAVALALAGERAPTPDYRRTRRRTRTRRGLLWLGQTCNLRCHFCYFLDRITDPDHPEHEFMTLEKARTLCDILVRHYGNNAVDIQGGEPTLHPDILELVRHCAAIGLQPTLITNAQVLDERARVEAFRAAGLRDFLVSVQGLGEVYDRIVGRPGAHRRQMLALRHLRECGVPFRFNVVMSRLAAPQLPAIAGLAISSGAQVVNFLAFNPFDDQRAGKRSAVNVPAHAELEGPLAEALDALAAAGLEANVRYLPFCRVPERHRPAVYDFQQLTYDHHENDFASWRWTFETPQRTRQDRLAKPHQLGPKLGLDRLRQALSLRLFRRRLAGWRFAHVAERLVDDRLVELENGLAWLERRLPFALSADRRYRADARRRAQRDLGYRHLPACAACDLRRICDGLHGDHPALFPADEVRPVRLGGAIDDPLHYIRHQEKIVQPQDHAWALGPEAVPR